MSNDHREAWLTDLFNVHSGAVLTYTRRRVASAEDAEDVVVEVFATAWRRRDAVPDAPLPWLYATASNVISHVIRSEGRRTRLGARLASVTPIHEGSHEPHAGVLDALEDRAAIQAALDELAESDAELLRLWAWEQLEPAEIALVLGITAGTARTRMHRARHRLREALIRRGVTGPAVVEPPPLPGRPSSGPRASDTPPSDNPESNDPPSDNTEASR